MTKMTVEKEDRREDLENIIADLGVSRVLIDTQIVLRVEQAIKRDAYLTDLLAPVVEHIIRIDAMLETALDYIGDEWRARNQTGW